MRAWEAVAGRPHTPRTGTSGATDAVILRARGIPTARIGLPPPGRPLPYAGQFSMGVVDVRARTLTYARAGHCPLIRLPGPGSLSHAAEVLAPDSFGPRGQKQVCGNGMVVSGNMRVADIAGALRFLATLPEVQPGKIGLLGHSHGGWTALRSVQKSYGLAALGLKAAVAYYPACQAQFDRDVARSRANGVS